MDNLSISGSGGSNHEVPARPPLGIEQVLWPQLDRLMLGAGYRGERRSYIGGSDANVIFSGEAAQIRRLWREKRAKMSPRTCPAR